MLVLGGHGVFGTMITDAAQAAGWTTIRTSRRPRLPRSAFSATPPPEASAEPVRHWIAVRRQGTLLAASTLRCQGDYQSAAAATVLMAGQLTGRDQPLPAGVLVPEEVLTIAGLEPGLAEAGITVVEEPAGEHSGPALAGLSRTGARELPGHSREVLPLRRRGCRSGAAG